MLKRGQVPIVDMQRSGIEKKDWKAIMSGNKFEDDYRKTRQYVPIDYAKNATIRPPWKFHWNRNTDKDISDWQYKYNYSLVTEADGYWPEGIPPNGSKVFVRGDLVLMKVPLEDWIERRKGELKRAGVGRKVLQEQFQNQCRHVGAQVSEEEINEAIGM